MECIRETKPPQQLNTRGCCFLCLKIATIHQKDLESHHVIKSISIRPLLRHMQIASQTVNGGSLSGHDSNKENIQVDLCENCGQMINRFSVLFQKLEKIQLEMNYFLERIQNCISQSTKDSELVQNYSKRMTSDLEALSQLTFVDNLRKQVAKESLRKSNVPRPQLVLTRVNSKPAKLENNEETSESNCQDFQGNYFSDDISPPPSPDAIANHEEDFKFCQHSASTSEIEKLSPSLKPPVKQKHKFFTEDSSTGLYKCNKCDKKSNFKSTLISHYKTVHLKLRYKCNICNIAVLKELSSLKKHKKTCRKNLKKEFAREEDPNFKFICKICGKRFNTKNRLNCHLSFVHKNVDRYPCDLCDKKFKKSEHLENHRSAVHFGKKFYCGFCSKSFSYSNGLRSHKKKCAQKLSLKKEAKNPLL